jgi:hypothetical protein
MSWYTDIKDKLCCLNRRLNEIDLSAAGALANLADAPGVLTNDGAGELSWVFDSDAFEKV